MLAEGEGNLECEVEEGMHHLLMPHLSTMAVEAVVCPTNCALSSVPQKTRSIRILEMLFPDG